MNLLNAAAISKGYGTRTLLDAVSLGLGAGDVIGVVGRNGDGKSTLLDLLTGRSEPDAGTVTRTGTVSIGHLHQADDFAPESTVRDVIVGGEPDHVWAADPTTRVIVQQLLGEVDLEAPVRRLSGGERRRTALVQLMLAGHDLIVLDEPTNHLDVEAVAWLAEHLRRLAARGTAMLVVSHDRWFLDEICTRIWEVHDAVVDAYDGGYAAYVLARAERARQAAALEGRRQNLLRKELAWLRRGPPARTSKPKFRIDAANALISDEPPARDRLQLEQFALSRLGKDVFDLHAVHLTLPPRPEAPDEPGRVLLDDLSWSIGPGDRIGLVGVNGAGKSTLLRLLAGEQQPDRGTVKQGRTLRVGHLRQDVTPVDPEERVLAAANRIRERNVTASGREVSTTSLLEDFGFTGDKLVARLGDLSGGERRRLQLLSLLLAEPNVLLLDEPTNDLDIDTLNVIEHHLDSWPGTLLVVSHDRYFLERVCDVTYALMGDGSCVLLPGGVEQYLQHRQRAAPTAGAGSTAATGVAGTDRQGQQTVRAPGTSAAQRRQATKELARVEGRLDRLHQQIAGLHQQMGDVASDHVRLAELTTELDALRGDESVLEAEWLLAAEQLE